jgi:myo-inositol-1(or 4)-monophosphatase
VKAQIPKIQKAVTEVLVGAGEYIRFERSKFEKSHAEIKGVNELVTHVDRTVEARLMEAFSRLLPESGFINEETGSINPGREYVWIIDPLDGTTNFVFDIPYYCISVALQINGQTHLGWVYDMNHREMFAAVKGEGAYCNKKLLRVSACRDMAESLIATGFPYRGFAYKESYIQLLYGMIHQTRGIRRLGSAALDLAYTAAGRFDGFFEAFLHPWDVAAGALLVEEAGGLVTDYHGAGHFLFGDSILATNAYLHEALLTVIRKFAD